MLLQNDRRWTCGFSVGAARNSKSLSETNPHPSCSLLWGSRRKPSLMEVAEKRLKEMAEGQARKSPALVAFLCRRQAFPRAHHNLTMAPAWDLGDACLSVAVDQMQYVNGLFILSFLLLQRWSDGSFIIAQPYFSKVVNELSGFL